MTIFSWGGDVQLYNLLQNIKFFVEDTYYLQAIIYVGTLLSVLVANLKFGLDPIKTGIKHILIATVYIQLFLTPSNQKVVIEDVVKNTALQVSNAPLGLNILLALSSQLEYYTTQAIESAFTTPNSLKINETGLGFGMRTHLMMMETMPINDDLLESFGLYYYNCLRPELYMKNKTYQGLTMSDDVLLALEPTVAFETLVYDNGASTQLSCEEALAWLKPKVDMEAYKYMINDLSSKLGMNSAKVENGIGDMNSVLYGVSKTAKDTLTQAMMRNLLNYGEIESAKLIGADVATATYSAVQARQQTRNNWIIAGKQAVENLPLMRITYYNLVVGAFIFFSLFSAITGQYKYVGLGVGILLSISLWNPIGALLNSFYYGEMEEYISSLAYLGDFLTIQKMDIISEKVSGILALMSNIYTYIPLIAMALVTGSFYGINSMASTTGANTGAIGGEVTKGNVDVGHTRIANATINAIDVATSQGHFSNKDTGITSQTSQKETANDLTYTQKDLNDKNGTIESNSSVGKVTASNQGLNDVQSSSIDSKLQNTMTSSSEKVNTASKTASSEISNSLIEQLNHTQGIKTLDTISNITGTSKETAKGIESSRVQAMEKALTSSLTEQEREELVKIAKAEAGAGINFRSNKEVLGWLAEKTTGLSVNAGGSIGLAMNDIDGNSKTISLNQQTAEKLSSAYKENFSESLKENKQVLNDITTSVENGTSRLSSQAINSTQSYSQALKEDESYKKAISNAQSRGYDLTTQVVEQAVKLQNPNFDNLTSSEKVNLTQGYLYDVSNGDKQALRDFKTAENIVVSTYANEVPTNHINKPSNSVNHSLQDNTNYSVDKSSLNSFTSNNPINSDDNKFIDTNNNINNGKNEIKENNKSDVVRNMQEWVKDNVRSPLDTSFTDTQLKEMKDSMKEKTNPDNSFLTSPISNHQEVNNSVTPKQIKEFKNDLEDMSEQIEKMNIEKTLTKGNEK